MICRIQCISVIDIDGMSTPISMSVPCFCLSVCLSLSLSVWLSGCLSVCSPACLSALLPVLSVCPSVFLLLTIASAQCRLALHHQCPAHGRTALRPNRALRRLTPVVRPAHLLPRLRHASCRLPCPLPIASRSSCLPLRCPKHKAPQRRRLPHPRCGMAVPSACRRTSRRPCPRVAGAPAAAAQAARQPRPAASDLPTSPCPLPVPGAQAQGRPSRLRPPQESRVPSAPTRGMWARTKRRYLAPIRTA